MAKIYGTPLMMGGGGSQNLTLPPMVTNLTAKGGNATITVSWTNPTSDALAGIAVVYNSDHEPERPSDGTKVDAGLVETIDLTGLDNGTLYYIRIFPYNAKKQYQTLIDGATTTARPSEGPKQVTDLQVTGSGGSPVLTWKNPTDDPTYHETVVIQKVDSAPTSLSDGTEIYRGTGETVTASGLEQLVNYYFGVFTINAEGGTRGPVVSDVYRYDFPSEPTEWSEVTKLTNSREYTFPEIGWFKIVAVAGSGNGSSATSGYDDGGYRHYFSGASGGSGGISVSTISTQINTRLSINISNKRINIPEINMSVTPGGNATTGLITGVTTGQVARGGVKGTATGGNIENLNGRTGINGEHTDSSIGIPSHLDGGTAVSTTYEEYKTTSGYGGRYPNGSGERGSNAYVVILRGNTNVPSPSAASTLSLLPTDSTLTVDWTNSGDPIQTGTMLVYNTNHVPTSANDGVSVDIPVTQATATTFAVDGEEQQADNKKQSYTITGLANNKPVYVALFPYDANKKYGIPKTDVEIPRVHSWYDTQQELKQEVQEAEQQVEAAEEQVEKAEAKAQEATEQAEQAQETVTMTRDFLPDAIAFTTPQIYDEWNPNGIAYTGKNKATESSPANIVRYQDRLYRCLQSHTSQADWNPTAAVSLWVEIADPAEEWPEWKQPTGAHDAYAQGAKVSHNGKKWTSDIAANVWEPGVYGWTEVIE